MVRLDLFGKCREHQAKEEFTRALYLRPLDFWWEKVDIAMAREIRAALDDLVNYLGSVALSVVACCADVSRSVMIDAVEVMRIVFSGLSALVIEDAEDADDVIAVRARTREAAVACPGCGMQPPACTAITGGRRPMCPSTAAASW